MSDMFPETMVGENGKCRFYSNSTVKDLDQYAKDWCFTDLRSLIAEQKSDGVREYILIRDNEVVFAHAGLDAVGVHIDIMAVNEGKKKKNSW